MELLLKNIRNLAYIAILIAAFFLLFVGSVFAAAATSANYQIESQSLNAGGLYSVSANYVAEDTTGERGTGLITGSTYNFKSGYRQSSTSICNNNSVCESGETVLSCPTDCVTAEEEVTTVSTGGTIFVNTEIPEVSNLIASTGIDTALIIWNTDESSIAKVSWGKTLNYEAGSLSEILFFKSHSVVIGGLEANTKYFFKLEIVSSFGNKKIVEGASFKTLPILDIEPPANVDGLEVVLLDGDVAELSWKNPTDSDFEEVVVVRSEEFYPQNVTDGEIIYRGVAVAARDKYTEKDKTYYYSVFAKDKKENYSSGAIISIDLKKAVVGEIKITEDPFAEFPDALEVHPQIEALSLSDFKFIQDGKEITAEDGTVNIVGEGNLKVSIDYDKVPEILKTIAVTMAHPDNPNKKFSFLLKINRTKTAYEATIGSLGDEGLYPVNISILDYKNQGVKKIKANVMASMDSLVVQDGGSVGWVRTIYSWFAESVSRLFNVIYSFFFRLINFFRNLFLNFKTL